MSKSPAASGSARRRLPSGRGWLANLRVRTKIRIAVGVTLISACAVAATGVLQMNHLHEGVRTINDRNVGGLNEVAGLRRSLGQVILYGMGSRSDMQALTEFRHKQDLAITQVDKLFNEYAQERTDDKQWRGLVGNFQSFWASFKEIATTLEKSEPNSVEYDEAYGSFIPALERVDGALSDLSDYEQLAAGRMAQRAASTFTEGQRTILAVLAAGVLLAIAIAGRVARTIVKPLSEVRGVVQAVAAGDLTRRDGVAGRDEVAQVAAAVNQASDGMRRAMQTMASNADALANNAEHLNATSDQIASIATAVSDQASVVSAAADQVSQNVQTVASGTAQMGISIQEIARNTTEGTVVAGEAVLAAEATNEIMTKLSRSSDQIGSIVKVISAIAQQTNLLALNATIEAARAGDAGLGFAVVASEVKDLSQETARATDDISRQVDAIQADSRDALAAISMITAVISQINDSQTTVSAALEEQTATTEEMSRNVAGAADGSTEIASSISAVAEGAERTMRGAEENQRSAAALARMSSELKQVVASFRL